MRHRDEDTGGDAETEKIQEYPREGRKLKAEGTKKRTDTRIWVMASDWREGAR